MISPGGHSAASNSRRIVGESDTIARLFQELQRVAPLDAKVLITGESGVGKELVASYVHGASRRAARPFVAVNCAGLPETLLESELFGHVRGSFTGAYRDKPGKFELADTGTLFLDEMGEMTLRMQGLLLRVLETGEIEKVGADRPTRRVDVRVIAATNRDLPDMIRRGLFREDLYYRLNVFPLHVPALRERPGDVPRLVEFFLQRIGAAAGTAYRCAPDVMEALEHYHWPGNVRQLENVVQRLAINSVDGVLTIAGLPHELLRDTPTRLPEPSPKELNAVAELLHDRIKAGASFWDVVYRPYMEHELTRADVRALIHKGLCECRGNYRVLTKLFNIDVREYRRFVAFLRKHQCLLPFRQYR